MRSISRGGFTLVEILTAISIAILIAGLGVAGLLNHTRMRNDQLVMGMAAALDQAQLDYLTRHPGGSLADPGAETEIVASVHAILRISNREAVSEYEAAIYGAVTFDVTRRPATCDFQGNSYTFPKARR